MGVRRERQAGDERLSPRHRFDSGVFPELFVARKDKKGFSMRMGDQQRTSKGCTPHVRGAVTLQWAVNLLGGLREMRRDLEYVLFAKAREPALS